MHSALAFGVVVATTCLIGGCRPDADLEMTDTNPDSGPTTESLVNQYAVFELTTDLELLTPNEKAMLPHLIAAAREMDPLFREQAFGPAVLASVFDMDDHQTRYFEMNYGPWDRIDGDAPFIEGVGAKPAGSNLYPEDMTKVEFETAIADSPMKAEQFRSLYTIIRRDASGKLVSVPYKKAFASGLSAAAFQLRAAADLASDPGLKEYLSLRADALVTDDYQASDMAWMDMKSNRLDIVIGAVETYEDLLFGYKAAYEGYVLVKDRIWSDRLARLAAFLPDLQKGLPVDEAYRQETPGSDADLNAYDVVYYAGQANAGSKTIAINLPNDEQVQLEKGTRRLQLKNAIQAKFDKILMPIAGVLIDAEQRDHVTFDGFFENTMFHEVAHGLGIKNTLNGEGTVRTVLKEHYSALEEGKADVLGLFMVQALSQRGELGADHDLVDNIVTFTAGIFRSIRFGASSAHGRANLIRYNYFREYEAFVRDPETGTYRVDIEKSIQAMNALSEKILIFQGDGDYEGVSDFVATYAVVSSQLQSDLDRLAEEGIPVDIVFKQGVDVLGL